MNKAVRATQGLLYVLSRLTLCFAVIMLSACMVGPDFHSPDSPKTHTYTGTPLIKKTVAAPKAGQAGTAQSFVYGQDIPAQWWHLYRSPEINELVKTGIANSPNLAAALAALHQAQKTYLAQYAATYFPSLSLTTSAVRQRFTFSQFGSPSTNPNVFNLFNVTPNVSYTLDLFGGARRQVEALRDQVDYAGFQLEAAYLTLTANIVTTAVLTASLRAQIQATHALIEAQAGQLKIVKRQFQLGGASGTDVLTQESQLAQTQATLPPLEQSLAQSQHALSVLVGHLPDETALPVINLSKLNLPAHLPVSLPSELARQRPDIRASEALLAAASAQIGVATANLYPQITLNGTFGWTNDTLGGLFGPENVVWSYGATLVQPLFNAGSLRAKRDAAVAAFQQAAAQYRQTVLQAFQNVADTLRALEHDAQALRIQTNAESAARGSLSIAQKQYQLGGVSYLSLLTAQRTYQQAVIGRIQAQTARYNDTAALFQALGGGWWHRCCNATLTLSKK